MKDYTAKAAFKSSLPVMVGYLTLGTAFGVLLAQKGYGLIWAFVMSLTIYAGSGQIVAVDLISSGASLITSAIMTLIVNARHIFYGISMLEKYRGTGKYKPYLIFSLTDETYALVSGGNPENTDKGRYFFILSVLNQCYWIAGSLIGNAIGLSVSFNSAGIDFSMTALFVVIFIEQLKGAKSKAPAFIGVICSVLCLAVFGAENFLIPSMLLIAVSLSVYGAITRRESKNG